MFNRKAACILSIETDWQITSIKCYTISYQSGLMLIGIVVIVLVKGWFIKPSLQ